MGPSCSDNYRKKYITIIEIYVFRQEILQNVFCVGLTSQANGNVFVIRTMKWIHWIFKFVLQRRYLIVSFLHKLHQTILWRTTFPTQFLYKYHRRSSNESVKFTEFNEKYQETQLMVTSKVVSYIHAIFVVFFYGNKRFYLLNEGCPFLIINLYLVNYYPR